MTPAPDGANEFGRKPAGWLKYLPLIAIAVIVVYLMVFWDGGNPGIGDGVNHSGVGAHLSSLNLQPLDTDGKPVSLNDVQGKVTLINYWGPWCYPCLVEMPELVELNQAIGDAPDFRFLSVACDPGRTSDLDDLHERSLEKMAAAGADWPVYADPDQSNRAALVQSADMRRGFGFPTTVLLDREGKIAAIWEGYLDGMADDMERAVRSELAEKSGS